MTRPVQHFFFPITRVAGDGEERVVEGYCFVNEVVEGEGGICLRRSAMEAATPDYLKWGAVRAMHQPIAAGTCIGVEWRDDGAYIRALIVDDQEWRKCEAGVYKGFSVGVTPKRMVNRCVEQCTWMETSLVDRPKDPDAQLLVMRLDDASGEADEEDEDRREDAADADSAEEDKEAREDADADSVERADAKSPEQVAFLLSEASPLSDEEKEKLRSELKSGAVEARVESAVERAGEFDPSKHPRDHGKFAKSGAGDDPHNPTGAFHSVELHHGHWLNVKGEHYAEVWGPHSKTRMMGRAWKDKTSAGSGKWLFQPHLHGEPLGTHEAEDQTPHGAVNELIQSYYQAHEDAVRYPQGHPNNPRHPDYKLRRLQTSETVPVRENLEGRTPRSYKAVQIADALESPEEVPIRDGLIAHMGASKSGERGIHAFRFDPTQWSQDDAKGWLIQHGFTADIEDEYPEEEEGAMERAEFDPSRHPRDHGKFAKSAGAGKMFKEESPAFWHKLAWEQQQDRHTAAQERVAPEIDELHKAADGHTDEESERAVRELDAHMDRLHEELVRAKHLRYAHEMNLDGTAAHLPKGSGLSKLRMRHAQEAGAVERAEFDPSKHPRDHGKFAKSAGAGALTSMHKNVHVIGIKKTSAPFSLHDPVDNHFHPDEHDFAVINLAGRSGERSTRLGAILKEPDGKYLAQPRGTSNEFATKHDTPHDAYHSIIKAHRLDRAEVSDDGIQRAEILRRDEVIQRLEARVAELEVMPDTRNRPMRFGTVERVFATNGENVEGQVAEKLLAEYKELASTLQGQGYEQRMQGAERMLLIRSQLAQLGVTV